MQFGKGTETQEILSA